MSDIRQQLEKLGIGDYAEAFKAEKIDFPERIIRPALARRPGCRLGSYWVD